VSLREHSAAVEEAAEELGRQTRAWLRGDPVNADLVSKKEHDADILKHGIRLRLTQTLWLPLSRAALLQLLWHQDEIADLCQDAALMMALRRPPLGIELEEAYRTLAETVSRVVHAYHVTISDFDEAMRGGNIRSQAAKVVEGVDRINQIEHESDLVEREIVATIYGKEDLPPFDRYHLIQLVLMLGGIVDQVENAAGDLRVLVSG
jgi:predicted phosphate transport protein (TIGR00153 family)